MQSQHTAFYSLDLATLSPPLRFVSVSFFVYHCMSCTCRVGDDKSRQAAIPNAANSSSVDSTYHPCDSTRDLVDTSHPCCTTVNTCVCVCVCRRVPHLFEHNLVVCRYIIVVAIDGCYRWYLLCHLKELVQVDLRILSIIGGAMYTRRIIIRHE